MSSYFSPDSWTADYESLVDLESQIRTQIQSRDRHPLHTGKSDSSIEAMLQEFNSGLNELKRSVKKASSFAGLTEQELQRRRSLVDELSERYSQLHRDLDNREKSPLGSSRSSNPFDQPLSYGSAHGPGSAHRINADEIRQQQQAMIAEQDRGLDAISDTLRRQQKIGLAIQGEVDEHNVIIDDIRGATSKATDKVQRQTRRVEEVRRKESCKCTCLLWSIIVVLALIIVIIPFV